MEKEKFIERKRLEAEARKLEKNADAVIVEGISDKIMLQKLGFESKIFMSAEKTVEDLREDVGRGASRVVVLTDFDTHGKEESKKISKALESEVDVIKSLREDFGAQLTSTGRRAIEDIRPLFADKEEKFIEARLDRLF